jgi:hypothetical protein
MKRLLVCRLAPIFKHSHRLAFGLFCTDLAWRAAYPFLFGVDSAAPAVAAVGGPGPTLACGATLLLALLKLGDPIVADRYTVFGARRFGETQDCE